MAEFKLQLFGGLTPKISDVLLPDVGATTADNVSLRSGELRGLRRPIKLQAFTESYTVRRVFRIPDTSGTNMWITFAESQTEFLKGALVNDAYGRYYWTDASLEVHNIDASAAVDLGSGEVGIPIINHTFEVGDSVVIAGTTNYNATKTVNTISTNQIGITASYVSETFSGSETVTISTPNDSKRAYRPMYNTLARLESGDTGFILGAPQPTNTPTLSVVGGSTPTVTRAYVYTWLSPYGEESAPSLPVVVTGNEDGSWNLANMDTAVSEASLRSSELSGWTKKVYRTITDVAGSADYYYVGDVAYATATYSDTSTTADIALNNLLKTTTWVEPNPNMRGIVAHPNGYFVGYYGRDIYFSEPYRPHAWPTDYILSTNYDIVGLAVFQGNVAVLTDGHPYIISGINPSVSALTRLEAPEPCKSHHGIVPIRDGVIYPSANGLMFLTRAGVTNITQDMFTREEWAVYDIDNIVAAADDNQYIAFDSTNTGFIFTADEATSKLTNIDNDLFVVSMLQTDPHTGDVFVTYNDTVYEWNPTGGVPLTYTWKSKEFITPEPINLGACKIQYTTSLTVSAAAIADFSAHNALRWAVSTPLNPLNSWAVNGRDTTVLSGTNIPSLRTPVGGSMLYNIPSLSSLSPSVTFNLYGDDELRSSITLSSNTTRKLATGYKAVLWRFEFIGNADLKSFKIAETGKGLARV